MRLVKIGNDLVNEDKFYGLFYHEDKITGEKSVFALYDEGDGDGLTSRITLASNTEKGLEDADWQRLMSEAAASLLFDLNKRPEQESEATDQDSPVEDNG